MSNQELSGKVVFITGAARRVGAVVVRKLHAKGMNIILHYRGSVAEAQALQAELQKQRADSVHLLQADLLETRHLPELIEKAAAVWQRLDVLINNASAFYPTPLGKATEDDWEALMGSNLKAPFFLAQAALPYLRAARGCIVNMVDIHAERPLKEHPIYSMAKAGLVMMTRSLAREMGPQVRVNAIAPGAILWPESGIDEVAQHRIMAATALKRAGGPDDIARAMLFLIRDSEYITGQVITVDGGRTLSNA